MLITPAYHEIFETLYQKLNPDQQKAVDTIEGPVLVVAGPGSGKTQLLSMRVANILRRTDTPAHSILCLTFTDSAAQNMRTRLRTIIGPDAQKVAIHTFHSLGNAIINQHPEYFFYAATYEPADDFARAQILNDILTSLQHDNPLRSFHPEFGWTYVRDITARIADCKRAGLTPQLYRSMLDTDTQVIKMVDELIRSFFVGSITSITYSRWTEFVEELTHILTHESHYSANLSNLGLSSWAEHFMIECHNVQRNIEEHNFSTSIIKEWRDTVAKKDDTGTTRLKDALNLPKFFAFVDIYEQYQYHLHANGLYDYDDMLIEVVTAMQKYQSLKYEYEEKYLYLLVDEFQDTNGVQNALLHQLINMEITDGRPNIMAVGDDDQAIYKFQSATLANILRFTHTYKNPTLISLGTNYRSTQDILDVATYVISQCSERLATLPQINKQLISHLH